MFQLEQLFALYSPWIVLGLAVLSLALILSLWRSRRRLSAIGSLIVPCLLTGVAFFGWPVSNKADLAEQLRQTRIDLSSVEADLATMERDNKYLRDRSTAQLKRYAEQLDDLFSAARLADGATDSAIMDFGEPSADTNVQRATATEEEIARLGRALRDARSAVRQSAKPTLARADAFRDLTKLKDRMTYGLKTDDYEVEVLPDSELIGGRVGRYYVIDLKDAENGVKFRFPGGKYTLARGDKKFRRALNTFVADVASKFEGNLRYGFFIRGNADSVPYRGRLTDGYEYKEVRYLKAVGAGRYVNDAALHKQGVSVRNADLPFLRARFLKDVVSSTYPVAKPVILEGEVSDSRSDGDRNVELILYVDW